MGKKPEQPKFGHYYLPETLDFMYCYNCVMIMLDKSEEAKETFEEIKKCWELPGCKQLLNGVLKTTKNPVKFLQRAYALVGLDIKEDRTLKLKDSKIATLGIRKLIKLIIFREKFRLFINRRKWKDYKILMKYIDDFVKFGFNRESDRAIGKYKITAQSSKTLVEAVYLLSLSEIKKIDLGVLSIVGKMPAIMKKNNTYTFEDLINNKAPRRLHLDLVDEYQNAGFLFRREDTMAQNANIWCQCRILYPSVEEYCNSITNNKNGLESANVFHQIEECDKALGYPRGIKAIK